MAIPLRKTSAKDGKPYQRRPEVEQLIDELEGMPESDQVQCCSRFDNPVPMEVLLYFLRQKKDEPKSHYLEQLFSAFFTRLEISVKKSISKTQFGKADIIREEIISQLLEKIAKDNPEGNFILDYYEVNFNDALQKLRFSVLREIGPASKKDPLSKPTSLTMGTSDGVEVAPGLEEAAAEFFNPGSSNLKNENFRFWLSDAIKLLPDKERRAVGLRLQGMQVEAKDPNTLTISKALGCTDRTVRNLLRRAYTKLQTMLPAEEEL